MTKVGSPNLGCPLWFIKVKFVKKRTPLQQIHKKTLTLHTITSPKGCMWRDLTACNHSKKC